MKVLFNLFFLFFLVQLSFGQDVSKLQILDKNTKAPVPYATIVKKNENAGLYADEKGYFDVTFQHNDTLFISCIGYFSKIIPANDVKKQRTIYLTPKTYDINEVVIKPGDNNIRIKHWGYDKSKSDITISNAPGATFVTYIPNETQSKVVLKDIIIPTKSKKRLSKAKDIREGYFRLHIFAVNDSGSPGKELLTKDMVYNTSDFSRKFKIELVEQNIFIPNNGIFVGIEWLGDNKGKEIRHGWKPFLCFTEAIDTPLTWTRDALTKNQWVIVDENNPWSRGTNGIINATFGVNVILIQE